MGCGRRSIMLVWLCHQLLAWFLDNGHLPRVLHQSYLRLMIRRVMRWNRGLCTDLLAFTLKLSKTSAKRPSEEGSATSNCLKWGPLTPNDVERITQHVREEEGRKLVKDGDGSIVGSYSYLGFRFGHIWLQRRVEVKLDLHFANQKYLPNNGYNILYIRFKGYEVSNSKF